jgi:hypothetical protein
MGRALALAGRVALVLAAASSAAAFPVHLPGKRHKAVAAANEGAWIVHPGAAQDIYANLGKHSQPMQAYVCTRGPGLAAPRVELQMAGRPLIDVQGCQSVYLLIGPGERLAIANPNPADVSGSYRLDLQSQLK